MIRLRALWSQYRPRYIRSLVYMMQACEYNSTAYLIWYWRVRDFSRVEHRKQLVTTPKAIVLLICGWACMVWVYGLWLFIFLSGMADFHLYTLLLLLVLPVIPPLIAYLMLVPLVLLEIVQKPFENYLVSQAAQKLARHKALKIAIAGSFGKTSMREVLRTVLSEGKNVAAPPGSYNTPLGITTFARSLTGNEEVLIFELGEYYPGDIKRLCEFVRPTIGVITGVNEAHLEKFGTLEKTTETIFELADFLGGKTIYINGENDRARISAREGHIVYSREGVDDWTVDRAKTGLEGTSFTLRKGNVEIPVRSKLLGLHMVGPLALAARIAFDLGLSVEQIEHGLEKTRPFAHRLERKDDSSGVITLDDSYNGNPDGVAAIIEFLKSVPRRRFYVTPGLVEAGSRTELVHRAIGKQLADARIEHVVLVRNSVTPFIERGLKEADFKGQLTWFEDALTAYAALPHLTVSGDVVVLQNDWPDNYV